MKDNVFTDLFSSVFKLKNYQRYGKEKGIRTTFYFLLLMAILTLVVIYKPYKEFTNYTRFINDSGVLDKLPEFTINEGSLDIEQDKTFTAVGDNNIFKIDPNLNISSVREDFLFYDTGIILTKDYAYVRFGGLFRRFEYTIPAPLKSLDMESITSEFIVSTLSKMNSLGAFVGVISFVSAYVSLLLFNLPFVFLISLMLSIGTRKEYISFKEILKITVHGSTVSLFFRTFETVLFTPSLINTFVIFTIAYIYINIGIKGLIKERSKA